jgi:hypothetical protein
VPNYPPPPYFLTEPIIRINNQENKSNRFIFLLLTGTFGKSLELVYFYGDFDNNNFILYERLLDLIKKKKNERRI